MVAEGVIWALFFSWGNTFLTAQVCSRVQRFLFCVAPARSRFVCETPHFSNTRGLKPHCDFTNDEPCKHSPHTRGWTVR